MEFDDEEMEMLGFGSFWAETREAIHQGANSSVVAARFHTDARRSNPAKAAETRKKNKERRRELAASAVRTSQERERERADEYRRRFRARAGRDTADAKRDQPRAGPPEAPAPD
jgi:hypothetical protein